MSENPVAQIVLDKLPSIVQGLSDGKARFQIECCIWCMIQTNHDADSVLRAFEGDKVDFYAVSWDESLLDYTKIKNSLHDDEGIEYGAEAIALILAILRTDFDFVKRSRKGGGDDYRLVKTGSVLFQDSAKLEISGILRENGNNSSSARLKAKLAQLSRAKDGLPSCAIVVEFSKFVAKVAWDR